MLNEKIATAFEEIADLLEIEAANPFRIRAYRKAALALKNFPRDVGKLSALELDKIPGIGKDLVAKILEFRATGKLKFLEELRKDFPKGLLEILRIPTVGPKTAKLFWEVAEVKNLAELETAARSGRLLKLPGIKAKTVENLLRGIAEVKRASGNRQPLRKVLPIANRIVAALQKTPGVKIMIAGSLRRKKSTIGDIDIIATARNPEKLTEAFVGLREVKRVIEKGKTKASVLVKNNLQVDLLIVEKESFGAALLYFTGNKAHNIRLRKIAIKKGWKLNEYGLFDKATGELLAGKTEKEIYAKLGLPFPKPEAREEA